MVEAKLRDSCTSWFYLLVVSVVTFFTVAFLDSYGVLMVFLVQHFNESNGKAAWVGSLAYFCTFSLFPVTLYMTKKFGSRIILLFAAILVVGTFLTTPLVPSMNYLFLTFSIPFGITCSILECTILTTIFDYFKTFRGVAFGARFGTGTLGTMMYAFLLPVLMAEFGWKWTFWVLTGMSLICLFFACVHKPRDPWKGNDVKPLVKNENNYLKHLKDKRFLIFLSANTSFHLVCLMPPMFMVRFATVTGIPISKAKWLMVIRTITSTITRFTAGRLGDIAFKHNKVGYIVLINMVLASLTTFLCSFTNSFPLLMLYMSFISVLDSIHWTFQPLFITEITQSINTDRGYAIMTCFGSFALLTGPPILGMLYDKTGDFSIVFYTTSAVLAIGACLMAIGLSSWSEFEENVTENTRSEDKIVDSVLLEQYISTV